MRGYVAADLGRCEGRVLELGVRGEFYVEGGAEEGLVLAIVSLVESKVGVDVGLHTHMFCPTPGKSERTGMFNCCRVDAGPIPETINSCGERNCIL